jgi:hypothetical protein
MEVTLGLNSAQLEKILEEAGLKNGEALTAELIRASITKAIVANNESIIKQLGEMMGQFNIGAIMQQFMTK